MEGFIILFVAGLIYFLPAVNAYSKKKRNAGAVLALNFFLGWTLIGWVIAFVWSATKDAEAQVVVHSKRSGTDELEKLADLKTKGVISEEEFKAQKKRVLES